MQNHGVTAAATDSVYVLVRDFIAQNFYVPDPDSLSGDVSLVDGGILDSTGVLELAAFLEKRFAIKVLDSELLPANLDSIDRVVEFIARKRGGRGE